MRRAPELCYLKSLRAAMETADEEDIQGHAARQERTIDALLDRLYANNPAERREIALLADEVGLGKTFVALGVAWSVLIQRERGGLPPRPVLVVTPNSQALFRKWRREAETFQKETAHQDWQFEVKPVEKPHELAEALSERKPRLVVARMSAFQGRLHHYDEALMAALHAALRFAGVKLRLEHRLALVAGWRKRIDHEDLRLHRSEAFWAATDQSGYCQFSQRHLRSAVRRMERVDRALMKRIRSRMQQAHSGSSVSGGLEADIRELARAALGQRCLRLPLVIVDEIHNWKNPTQGWERFLHMLGGRIERILGLSATPFQLGPQELRGVLRAKDALDLLPARSSELQQYIDTLDLRMDTAHHAGSLLREAWSEVVAGDLPDIEAVWFERKNQSPLHNALPPRLRRAVDAAIAVERAHHDLGTSLRPFVIRHLRDAGHRAWRVGRDASTEKDRTHASGFAWRPGLDVSGDAELIHYLMMRAVQECKQQKGSTTLGADLGGSYEHFLDKGLAPLKKTAPEAARPYLELVERAVVTDRGGHEHPKVAVTAERAFQAWRRGEKTLVFCFNVKTVAAVQEAVGRRIHQHEAATLASAFGCTVEEYPSRLENFQRRLYDPRQALFLLFQDHPLAGQPGRVHESVALTTEDLQTIAALMAGGQAPREHGRFDRRRLLAAAEQVLVEKWQRSPEGRRWLDEALQNLGTPEQRAQFLGKVLSPDWPNLRRQEVQGVQREGEAEPFELEGEDAQAKSGASPDAWFDLINGRAGRAVLAPYLVDGPEVPSLLTRRHGEAMFKLPLTHRALAARMFRRVVRSPGFLARFLLDDPSGRSALENEDEQANSHWSEVLHARWCEPPADSESAIQRFTAYFDTLIKSVGREELFRAYEDASRNIQMVARVTGAVSNVERDRLFHGFNTPLIPEVLVVTSVGQEGIDLHRECRHVIHHDMPWNPATLEQRTGRVDRIGSKTERLPEPGWPRGRLDVVVPYVANTYDEHRFRRVHARAQLFEVTMGSDFVLDDVRRRGGPDEDPGFSDDVNVEDTGQANVQLPESIACALRMKLEA